ncbi:MAG: flagellar basal body rod protein FlgB [Bdellovibrio sp.]|nr:MAG: flagellar basal body rod protein FlgB [Bdellovibrio sp.]
MSDLFDKTTDALASSLNFRLIRQNITAANIANAETPGYKAKKIDFEEALEAAIDRAHRVSATVDSSDHFPVGAGPISKVRADIYDNPEGNVSNDGNTVDMEKEMATMAENSILYKAALRLINKKLGLMKYAVTEGGRR